MRVTSTFTRHVSALAGVVCVRAKQTVIRKARREESNIFHVFAISLRQSIAKYCKHAKYVAMTLHSVPVRIYFSECMYWYHTMNSGTHRTATVPALHRCVLCNATGTCCKSVECCSVESLAHAEVTKHNGLIYGVIEVFSDRV